MQKKLAMVLALASISYSTPSLALEGNPEDTIGIGGTLMNIYDDIDGGISQVTKAFADNNGVALTAPISLVAKSQGYIAQYKVTSNYNLFIQMINPSTGAHPPFSSQLNSARFFFIPNFISTPGGKNQKISGWSCITDSDNTMATGGTSGNVAGTRSFIVKQVDNSYLQTCIYMTPTEMNAYQTASGIPLP